MLCRVIILPEGGTEPIADLAGQGAPDAAEWAAVRQDLVARSSGKDERNATETYLCLLGDELVVRRDSDSLGRWLRAARDHTWGSKLFLVVSQGAMEAMYSLDAESLLAERSSMEEWFTAARSARVCDFLQIPYDRWEAGSIQPTVLRTACSRAGRRQELLASCPRHRPWRCLVQGSRPLTAGLLAPYWLSTTPPDDGASLLLVVTKPDEKGEKEQARWVSAAFGNFPHRACRVATLAPPTSELFDRCAHHGAGAPVSLAGDFELLWYLLLRLNSPEGAAVQPRIGDSLISAVLLDKSPLLTGEHRRSRFPQVLLSSGFSLSQSRHLEEAARDVGALLGCAPLEAGYRVEPALTLDRLSEVVRTQPPDIWIHMGHGEAGGLQEYGRPEVTAVERWLDCFYGCELQLAMFLACDSDLFARRFAQAGAAVAIGFTGRVLTDKPRTLGREVFQAAMSSGGSRETVLAAFLGGAHRFAGVHEEPAEARVYYPVPW